ncbi:Hypothetical predicted protein [Mytilus galloprovincialis]|uniref:Ig-like domain-containing protein n=1 Tax=Mytilus galloprovincialis TaxID=29158 RepID=A0A8B6FCE0_MYTGA|nr:Hypothetical predicted protein [Mytilus galloprovincialis]
MSVTLFTFVIVLTQDITTQVNVDLQGPLYARSGDTIWVNCSSNTVPAGESAEFLLDGETINSLRRHNNGCYSASTSKECTRDICQCSENGKTYGIRINMNHQKPDVNVEIVCSMKFKTGRTFYLNDSISINVLDITNPKISPVGSPLVSGTNINLSCSLITTLDIQMHWDCLNLTSLQFEQRKATYTATFFLHLRSRFNGRKCTCVARFKQITTSSTITLNISSPPLITISNPTECNVTSNIMLFCALSGDLQTYGFYLWTHKMNGHFIRHLKGNVNKVTSTLLISSCSFEDSGEYICSAWNQIGNEKYESNKTTTITVNQNIYSDEYEKRSTQHYVNMTTVRHTDSNLSITYGPLAGGLVLFVSLFVGVNIGISRKCRTVNLENRGEFMRPNVSSRTSIANTTTELRQIENNLSVYESINENEMIQVPADIGVQDKTESASVSSCSRTSKSSSPSNRSYLEVVDYSFYLKPYEILQCHRDSDFVHLYSTTVNKFEYKSDSSSTESSMCPQRNCLSEIKQGSPEQSTLYFLPIISNESTGNDENPITDMKGYCETKTPAIMIENISDEVKTNSLSKSISNYEDISEANSNQSSEIQSSSNKTSAMSTIL